MNEKTAYAIAAAVEKKLGDPISLWRNEQLWTWGYMEHSWSLFRNSDYNASQWAQWLLNEMRTLQPKITIRRKPKDEG